ncbi:MAG TPA: transcriptional repressor [Acidimicrobiales bacterium]
MGSPCPAGRRPAARLGTDGWRATVNELVAMGEVDGVTASDGPKRYDPNVTDGHQHLVGVHCGDLCDVHPLGEHDLQLPGAESHGYQLVDVDIVFRGVCERCQAEGRAAG